ncbi:MAG: hypothetical protein U1U88_000528 [Lawsonella clevelandensis]
MESPVHIPSQVQEKSTPTRVQFPISRYLPGKVDLCSSTTARKLPRRRGNAPSSGQFVVSRGGESWRSMPSPSSWECYSAFSPKNWVFLSPSIPVICAVVCAVFAEFDALFTATVMPVLGYTIAYPLFYFLSMVASGQKAPK